VRDAAQEHGFSLHQVGVPYTLASHGQRKTGAELLIQKAA
jgi:hypothetical protein